MQPGQRVAVQPEKLFAKHPGLRFDNSQGPITIFAPRGAEGQVLRISDDRMEALVELYWNPNGRPGAGDSWRVWVKREWFGQLLGG